MSGEFAVLVVEVVDCGEFGEFFGSGDWSCAMMVRLGVGEKSGVAQNVAQCV